MRSKLEVADIFRRYGETFRAAQGNRLSLDLTLRPEVEVGPGGLKDGFVMVSGLGPSWSASGVVTLRQRLVGRAG
jgi:hypothetical protein